MGKVEGRKYEVELPDGRVISRQRAHQLKKPQLYKKTRRKHYESHKEALRAKAKEWRDKFEEEHDMTYARWYYLKKKEASDETTDKK